MTLHADRPIIINVRVRQFTQILQQNPRAYRGFGWLWWGVKAALKAQVTQEELYLLGDANDPEMVQLAAQKYGTAAAVLEAARDHYEQRAMFGQLYAKDDHDGLGRPCEVIDEDAGYANL